MSDQSGDEVVGTDDPSAWADEQRKLIAQQTVLIGQQTANIGALAESVGQLAQGLNKRPTTGKVIALVAVMSILTNIATVGTVLWVRDDITERQEQSATRGKSILELTERVDDCLDTTVDDGDPIGKCAAESQARFAYAVSQVTANVTCAQQKFYLDLIAANPGAGLTPPAPRPECDADGSD